jgi:2-amino-4-hydroxy-6-hydroxymethyldihydropteridine diphosphokinase
MKKAIVLMGSNTDSLENINKAKSFLIDFFGEVLFSKNIESDAVDNGKGIYLNTVAIFYTALCEKDIVKELKKIETLLGRKKDLNSSQDVSIDLDLVQIDDLVLRPDDAEKHYYRSGLGDFEL